MQNVAKKMLIAWLLIYSIILTPVAYASAGGWSFSGFDIATGVLTAVKNGLKTSASVGRSVSVANIAKGVGSGIIAGAALPLAISQITGIALNAVDFVIDPENNTVKYRDKTITPIDKNKPCPSYASTSKTFLPSDAPLVERSVTTDSGITTITCKYAFNGFTDYVVYKGTAYNNYKTIPISTVADKIYDNAKAGDAASIAAVNQAAQDYVNSGAADAALNDAASHNCGTGTSWNGSACVADPTKPADPAKPLDLSSILSVLQSIWDAIKNLASQIVEPIKTVINSVWDWMKSKYDWWVKQWETFVTGVKDFFTWFREEPEKPKDGDGSLPDVTIATDWQSKATNSYVRFGGSCPAPVSIPIQFMGASQNLTISYVPFCEFATKIRPAVILGAWIAGLMIITGGRTKE